KRGRKSEADALFQGTFDLYRKRCEEYPNAATLHNGLAWLAVECHREPGAALEHAEKAVALSPKTTAYLDTLAEVMFSRGDPKQAAELMQQCVDLEPKVQRHRKQLDRFRAASGATTRPVDTAPIGK